MNVSAVAGAIKLPCLDGTLLVLACQAPAKRNLFELSASSQCTYAPDA